MTANNITMAIRLGLLAWTTAASLYAYEALQGPTELLYRDKTNTCSGYTWFGVRGTTYLVDTEGHVIEVTPAGDAVWEYINPVSSDGAVKFKTDNWPMYNSIFRAFCIGTNDPAISGRTLVSGSTITGRTPSYQTP